MKVVEKERLPDALKGLNVCNLCRRSLPAITSLYLVDIT